jgi:flagellar hook-associated protein 2
LTDYNERLDAMNDQLQMMQDRYYRQFDAMETAISRMNQQSSWLSQQLGQS